MSKHRRQRPSALGAAILLVACKSTAWAPDTDRAYTENDITRDLAACVNEANLIASQYTGYAGVGAFYDARNNCMRGKGWILVETD